MVLWRMGDGDWRFHPKEAYFRQVGDMGNLERRITGQLWAVSLTGAAQSRDKE